MGYQLKIQELLGACQIVHFEAWGMTESYVPNGQNSPEIRIVE